MAIRFYLGADHNGYALKEQIKRYLTTKKIPVQDLGAERLVARDDYPDYAIAVARKVAAGGQGILVCGSGHGMAIAANKIDGARAALCATPFSAKMAKHDDHANILVLASWENNFAQVKKIIAAWLTAQPSRVPRHLQRIKKITRLEQ